MTTAALVLLLLACAVVVVPARTRRLWNVLGKPRRKTTGAGPAPEVWRLPALAALATTSIVCVIDTSVRGVVVGLCCGLGVFLALRYGRKRLAARSSRSPPKAGKLELACTCDLLAACLRAGLPVATAVGAVAATAPSRAMTALGATADLLALGATPEQAWEPALRCEDTAELATAAVRTARSGSALAAVASELAERARQAAADEAEAASQRAGVLITGPLGLCFLPAFLCLGVLPVVIGLAGQLTALN
ncbi:type II secretion system F family protein [Saccharomonospora sp. NPDC006951]